MIDRLDALHAWMDDCGSLTLEFHTSTAEKDNAYQSVVALFKMQGRYEGCQPDWQSGRPKMAIIFRVKN